MVYDKRYLLLSLLFLGLALLMRQALPKHADIVIFSPHPDDATLCCAGLIQQTLAQGKTVHIVDITDGDGFLEAAAALNGKSESELTPKDMLTLDKTRRKEELRAMAILGITPLDVTFLGYPDGWLDEVYKNESDIPFTNPFTKRWYARTHAPYTNKSLITDLITILRDLNPNQIIVNDTKDNALDHSVVGRAVMEAIQQSKYAGSIRTYVIHANEDIPKQASNSIHLTDDQKQKKAQAIEAYTSQLIVEGEYLRSFVRDKEAYY